MEFTDQSPSSKYWIPPKYATGSSKFWLKLMGYDAAGNRNNWGKLLTVIGPSNGLLANYGAQRIARNNGADGTQENVLNSMHTNASMFKVQAGAGKILGGAMSGNQELISDGVSSIGTGFGELGSGANPYKKSSSDMGTQSDTTGYGAYKTGNKVKPSTKLSAKIYHKDDPTEDIDMVDKTTGEKIGEMRYHERIFDQDANIKMEKLKTQADKTKNYSKLGKFISNELDTHDDFAAQDSSFETGGLIEKDGMFYDANGKMFNYERPVLPDIAGMMLKTLMPSGGAGGMMGGGGGGGGGGGMSGMMGMMGGGAQSGSTTGGGAFKIRAVGAGGGMKKGGKTTPSEMLKRKYADGNKVTPQPDLTAVPTDTVINMEDFRQSYPDHYVQGYLASGKDGIYKDVDKSKYPVLVRTFTDGTTTLMPYTYENVNDNSTNSAQLGNRKATTQTKVYKNGGSVRPSQVIQKFQSGGKTELKSKPNSEIMGILYKAIAGKNDVNYDSLSFDERVKLDTFLSNNVKNYIPSKKTDYLKYIRKNYYQSGEKIPDFTMKPGDKLPEINVPKSVLSKNKSNTDTTITKNINQTKTTTTNTKTNNTPVVSTTTARKPSQLVKASVNAAQGNYQPNSLGITWDDSKYNQDPMAILNKPDEYKKYSEFVKNLPNDRVLEIFKGMSEKTPLSDKYRKLVNDGDAEKLKTYMTDGKIGLAHRIGFTEYQNNSNAVDYSKINEPLTGKDTTKMPIDKNSFVIPGTSSLNTSTTDTSSNSSAKNKSDIGQQISNYTDYAMNGVKAITGIIGANKPLPSWTVPLKWQKYVEDSEMMSKKGFTNDERAVLDNQLMSNRSAGVEAVRQTVGGGGASGAVLAALDGLNRNSAIAVNDINMKDATLQRQNFAQYGNVLGKDVAYDRQIFEDEYSKAAQSKEAYSKLAQSGMQGMIDQSQFNETYGPGSNYDQLQKAIIEEQQLTNAALKQNTVGTPLTGALPYSENIATILKTYDKDNLKKLVDSSPEYWKNYNDILNSAK